MHRSFLLSLLILPLLQVSCQCNRNQSRSLDNPVSTTPDTINIHYGNLNELRFANIGPIELLRTGRYKTISLARSSLLPADSVYFSKVISLIEDSRNNPSRQYVSPERRDTVDLQWGDSTILAARYSPVPHVNAYFVIESIFGSNVRDSVTLSQFKEQGIYHSKESYIVEDNGLFDTIMVFLSTHDPEWGQ